MSATRAESARQGGEYDLVVLGGSLAGSSLALLVSRWNPGKRVLVIERTPCFGRRVGEATVEVSSAFLTHVLKLSDHLARAHLPKHGLRFWFADEAAESLHDMSEIGPRNAPEIPSFQLDRSRLDETVAEQAAHEGAQFARPAKVVDVELAWPRSRVVYEDQSGTHAVHARWVVDATGRAAYLARRLGHWERNERHPVNALWARWKGVRDLDGPAFNGLDPLAPRLPRLNCARRQGTNHFCGHGWWCWVIPLAGGLTSIGLVHDRRHFDPAQDAGAGPEGSPDTPRASYERFLRSRPGLRELVADAQIDGDDFQSYRDVAYRSRRVAGPGWLMVGDALGFIDPYYSPGLDVLSMSVYAGARLIGRELSGELAGERLERTIQKHDRSFTQSQVRWFEAIYEDKYELLGDAELVATAFLLDTSMYYLGVVSSVMRQFEAMGNPVFGVGNVPERLSFAFMRLYRGRLLAIARKRRERGTYGRRNSGWRCYAANFGSAKRTLTPAARRGLALWMGVEMGELIERVGLRRGPRAARSRRLAAARATVATSEEPL